MLQCFLGLNTKPDGYGRCQAFHFLNMIIMLTYFSEHVLLDPLQYPADHNWCGLLFSCRMEKLPVFWVFSLQYTVTTSLKNIFSMQTGDINFCTFATV